MGTGAGKLQIFSNKAKKYENIVVERGIYAGK